MPLHSNIPLNPEYHPRAQALDPEYTDDPIGCCDWCGDGSTINSARAISVYSADGDAQGPWYCGECHTNYLDHGSPGEPEPDEDEDEDDRPERREHETLRVTEDHQPSPPVLMLPIIPGRGARIVSCEQEVGSGGEDIAQRLYSAGHSVDDFLRGYHSGESGGFCRVEEDGSVNAEIIYGMLRLEHATTAQTFESALSIVRDAVANGDASLDMRCGFHTHVGIQGYSMKNVESLYHLWNHLEDAIYRLASANWRKHRTEVASTNYATATHKGLSNALQVGQHFENYRGALNLGNYLASRSACRCGAFSFAAWEHCTCQLKKPTVEFRVFNATANLRKIHAYTALSVALVEAAHKNTYTADTHPAHPWRGTDHLRHDEAEKQLTVIFDELPFTPSELADLDYCARSSSLAPVMGTRAEPEPAAA